MGESFAILALYIYLDFSSNHNDQSLEKIFPAMKHFSKKIVKHFTGWLFMSEQFIRHIQNMPFTSNPEILLYGGYYA